MELMMTGNGDKWRLTDIRNLLECIKPTDKINNLKPPNGGFLLPIYLSHRHSRLY